MGQSGSGSAARVLRGVLVGWVVLAAAGCRAGRKDDSQSGSPRQGISSSQDSPAEDPWSGDVPARDYAAARAAFRTTLVRAAPSPQSWQPVQPPADAREIELRSGGHLLRAWISKEARPGGARAPAVLFLHGGFAFAEEDWDMAKPFRDAGFVVMTPMLRGENGLPGAFSLYYDEVDDVLAAAELLAGQPQVDPNRLYVTGHSAGGTLAMLAAMISKRFRAAAPLAGTPDALIYSDDRAFIRFDPKNDDEYRMRSPLVFASSFKCPARLYFGDQELLIAATTRETARRAKRRGLDVEAIAVEGNHSTMVARAIPLAIAFFEQQR
jgi:dienelactone hydrolase